MKNNLFQFDDTYWLQLDGTAMGTPTACLYATISYGVHERNKLLPSYQAFLKLYLRFIDDVFGIWIPSNDGHDELHWSNFQKTMNEWGKLRWIPTSCFKGLIVGNFLRFRKQNTDENFSTLIKNFANHLLARGHSLTAIKHHFKKSAISIDQKRTQQKLQQPTPAPQQPP